MAVRVDPTFKHELIEYGLQNIDECFNCGNCTAICSHTEVEHALPRITIRMMQLGLREADWTTRWSPGSAITAAIARAPARVRPIRRST